MTQHPQTARFRNLAQESEDGWAIGQLCDLLDAQYAQTESALAEMADGSKPRVVTTIAELDALPVRSVVLRNGRAFQRFTPQPAPFDEYRMWKCTDGGFVRSTKDGSSILPATVLHEPEAEATR